MIKAIQKHLSNRKGFTLIELIVVIVILGILAAILVPTFSGYVTKARKGSDEVIIGNVKTIIAVARAEGVVTSASVSLSTTAVGLDDITVTPGTGYTEATAKAEILAQINANLTTSTLGGYTTASVAIASTGAITITKDGIVVS